jgi:hypothetical protein
MLFYAVDKTIFPRRREGLEPRFRNWDGNGSLVHLVLSLNLHRRHLTDSQRAMVGARSKPLFEEEAKARQVAAGGDKKSEHAKSLRANLPEAGFVDDVLGGLLHVKPANRQSRDDAANTVNVSPRSVEAASKVLKDGTPELVKAVERGEVLRRCFRWA